MPSSHCLPAVPHSFHVKTLIASMTSVMLMKLSIVLTLIAHPVSGKACLGQGVTNAGTDNPFESNLTGHWPYIEHQFSALVRPQQND